MEILNAVPKVIKDETVRINKYTILERKKCKLFYIHLFRHPLTTVHDQRDSFNIHSSIDNKHYERTLYKLCFVITRIQNMDGIIATPRNYDRVDKNACRFIICNRCNYSQELCTFLPLLLLFVFIYIVVGDPIIKNEE